MYQATVVLRCCNGAKFPCSR